MMTNVIEKGITFNTNLNDDEERGVKRIMTGLKRWTGRAGVDEKAYRGWSSQAHDQYQKWTVEIKLASEKYVMWDNAIRRIVETVKDKRKRKNKGWKSQHIKMW